MTATPSRPSSPLFPIGAVVATPGAIEALAEAHGNRWRIAAKSLLARHQSGDWGETCKQDAKTNDWAVGHEARIISCYHLPARVPGGTSERIWLITEADRSSTTILLPSEY